MPKFEMSPLIHRWVKKQVRCNMWRMPKWIGEEDLHQEGKVYWVVVNERYHKPNKKYPQGVTDIKHMMGLFMTSFNNRLHDLAANRKNPRKERHLEDMRTGEAGDILEAIQANDWEDANIAILEAPEPVQTILRLLITTEEGNLDGYARVYLDDRLDTVNLRLYRALRRQGFNVAPNHNFLSMARSYLVRERQRLHEPTVIEMVGVMVDEYTNKSSRPIISLPSNKDGEIVKYKVRRDPHTARVTLTPTIEVVHVHRQNPNNHTAPGVRRRPSYTKSRIQVPQCAWSPLRPGVHRNWAASERCWGQQRRNGGGLQRPQGPNEPIHRERLGPRVPVLGRGPRAEPVARQDTQPQDGLPQRDPHG